MRRPYNHESRQYMDQSDLADLAHKTFSAKGVILSANSRVGRATWAGRPVALKDYRARDDSQVRAFREWRALTFLWEEGLTLAPEPLGAHCSAGLVAMEWIESSPSFAKSIVDDMIEILVVLKDLSVRVRRSRIGDAADSIRLPTDLLRQVDERAEHLRLNPAVNEEVLKVLHLSASLQAMNFPPTEPVLTLSPSDFGPHNLLPTPNGTRLIDLEFFGWDDAHKLVADTIVHPGFSWPNHQQDQFSQHAGELFGLDSARLSEILMMSLVKWSVIILARASREFARGDLSAYERSLMRAQEFRLRALEYMT